MTKPPIKIEKVKSEVRQSLERVHELVCHAKLFFRQRTVSDQLAGYLFPNPEPPVTDSPADTGQVDHGIQN